MIPKNVQMPNPNPKYKPPGTTAGGRGGHMKGCKDCPAFAKCTVTYRGSACAALRGTYGLDSDPEIITNADRIRTMSDEKLAEELVIEIEGLFPSLVYVPMATGNIYISRDQAEKEMLEYLQQPAEEEP